MYANIEYYLAITALGKRLDEHELLNDPGCDSPNIVPARTTKSIGVGYVGSPTEVEKLQTRLSVIRGYEFGGRGRVRIEGKLRITPNERFRFRFDISSVKTVDRVVLPYQGSLKLGWFYSDTFRGGEGPQLSSRLKMPLHYAGHVEWANADQFPILLKKGLRSIIFRPVTETVQMIAPNRWNSTFRCEIVEAK
jgi:hypothetical protein